MELATKACMEQRSPRHQGVSLPEKIAKAAVDSLGKAAAEEDFSFGPIWPIAEPLLLMLAIQLTLSPQERLQALMN